MGYPQWTPHFCSFCCFSTSTGYDGSFTTSASASSPSLFPTQIHVKSAVGYLWNLSGNNKLGLDVFVDYVPWGFLGSENNNMSLVEISPIVNDCEQPKANVTVNPLVYCNNFNFQCLNAGLKLVYSFDINHAKKVCTDEEK